LEELLSNAELLELLGNVRRQGGGGRDVLIRCGGLFV
jgi:hypothetical protein